MKEYGCYIGDSKPDKLVKREVEGKCFYCFQGHLMKHEAQGLLCDLSYDVSA